MMMFPTCGAMFKQSSYYFKVELHFLPKFKKTFRHFLFLPVLWSTKAPGGIKVVINLISTDIILVDHLTLLLMESTGKHLEVNISLKVLRWGFGPNSNKRWWDFTMEKCTRTNQEASVFWYISSSGTKGQVLGTGRQNHEQNRDQQELSSSSRLAPGNMLPKDLLQNKFKSIPCVYTSPHPWCSCP